MASKKRRRKRSDDRYRIYDPRDGLEINQIRYGRNISRYKSCISIFDSDNVFIEENGKQFGREVSVIYMVRRVNRHRCTRINGDKDLLNRKA